MKSRVMTLVLVSFFVVFPQRSPAQAYRASLTGIVTDPSGAVLPGVSVTVTNQATNVAATTVSDERGRYSLLDLNPGQYELRAELTAFKSYIQRDITLLVDQVGRIDVKLEVGSHNEEIRVIGEAPLLNTESSAKGQVVTHQELIDLPLEGRDFNELAFLTPGVTPKNQGGQGGFANVNGARADSINFVVEGGSNNVLRGGAAVVRPSLDAIQEYNVQTSSYSAEYGRRSTGVINMVLRSGTNDFHGTLYSFHRNAALDARNFFDQDKSKLIRNNFGVNLGGPVVRDRLFFFVNYEGMRRREGRPRLTTVPTLKQREGDFSEFPDAIRDPLTGKNFTGNIIPKNMFHAVSSRLLEHYPLPNRTAEFGGFNYFSNKVDADDFDDFVGKTDWHFGKGDNVSVRYLLNHRNLSNPFAGSVLPGFGNTGLQRLQMVGINYTHMFRPRLLNQTLRSFSRKTETERSVNWETDFAGRLGIDGLTDDPALFGFPRFTIRNYEPVGDAANMPLRWIENDYQLGNMTMIVSGSHNLKIGGEVIRTQFAQLFANDSRGIFNFLGRWTGEPFADFLLGFLNNSTRRVKQTTNYLTNNTYALYIQDDWKLRPNLTVNLGLRYDLFVPPSDQNGNWSNFVPEVGRVVLSGEEGYPRSLVHSDRNNLAPRIGFAWRPFGRKTVVRAGYGTFFGLSILNPLRLALGANPPFTIRETFSRNTRDPMTLTFSSPFPSNRATNPDVTAPTGYELRPGTANLHQYNFTIEHQFGIDTVLEVGYVGSKGTHLGRQYDVNQPRRDAGLTAPFPRPFPGFGGITYFAFEADSSYHALQAGIRKRSRGVNYRLNYVLSKSIDDASQLSGRGDGGFSGVQDARNRAAERGLSDFDRRHGLTGSILYQLPLRGARMGRLGYLARGWQVNSIVRLYSGTPITPQLANFDFNAGEAKRPDRIGSGRLANPTHERWYRVEDFVPVPAGAFRFGNSGRGIIRGPAEHHFNFSVMRYFNLPNEHRLQLRWEIFNLPNFTNFQLPEEEIDRPTAGIIRVAGPARQMQVALKYIF